VTPLHGETFLFSGDESGKGDWRWAGDWNPNGIPLAEDTAVFLGPYNEVLLDHVFDTGVNKIQIGPPLTEPSATFTSISAKSDLFTFNSVTVNGDLWIRRGFLQPLLNKTPRGRIVLGTDGDSEPDDDRESWVIVANQGSLLVGNFSTPRDVDLFGEGGAAQILGVPQRLAVVSTLSLEGREDLGFRPTADLTAAHLTINSIRSANGDVTLSSDTRLLSGDELLAGGHFSESIRVGDIMATDSTIGLKSGFRWLPVEENEDPVLLMTPVSTGHITLHDSTMTISDATPGETDPEPIPTNAFVGAIELHNSQFVVNREAFAGAIELYNSEFVANRGLQTDSITLRGGSRFSADSVFTATIDASEGSELEIQQGAGEELWLESSHAIVDASEFNTVLVDNGSRFTSFGQNEFGSVTVRGDRSVWEASTLSVGESEFPATLVGEVTVLDGGLVSFGSGKIGTQSDGGGIVEIRGHGSQGRSEMIQTSDELFFVGAGGTGYLTIDEGARLKTVGGTVLGNDGQGTVEVKGASGGYRSAWLNSGVLDITGGSLAIENGGLVSTGGSNLIGALGGHGLVEVNGVFGEFRSTLEGSEVIIGGGVDTGGSGSLSVDSGGLVNSFGRSGIDGLGQTSATVRGAVGEYASTWNNAGLLTVGESAMGTLSIENGGLVQNQSSAIGDLDDSNGTVEVKGVIGNQRATWNNSLNSVGGQLTVGNAGTGTLEIENGGLVESIVGHIGFEDSGIGTVTVNGEENGYRSTWQNALGLTIGESGAGELWIENGGSVTSSDGYIGKNASSFGAVTVTGTGSTWTNARDLTVGESGTAVLDILKGGSATTLSAQIGGSLDASGKVTVSDSGSHLSILSDLDVGSGLGSLGELKIENGGSVTSSDGYIGKNASSFGAVTVTGTGSIWTNARDLTVGDSGTAVLDILKGGSATTLSAQIGGSLDASGKVTVSDSGSHLSILSDLDVGSGLGSLGELKIENGGSVTSVDGYIGKNASSFGAVTVTGTGSTWTNTRDLTVGDLGTAVLDILKGGSAATFSAQIGGSLDSNGKVTVSDSGSHLSILKDLDVGSGLGSLGELKIENGGSVSADQGFIGRSNVSSGLVTIKGSGSRLSVSNGLDVGLLGTGELRIENGGGLSSYKGGIGGSSGSSGTVIVDGIDSSWAVASDLEVGFFGSGELRIENGGSVLNQNGFIAKLIESSGSVLVAGAGSQWNNSGYLTLGGQFPQGPGSAFATGELTVGDGGLVRVGDTLQVNNGSLVNLQIGGTITVPRFQLSGSLELDGTLIADNFFAAAGATVTGSGKVLGNVYNSGIFIPGNSPGVLTVDGDFTQGVDGQLLIEIAGLDAGIDYDQLIVSGAASIEGVLQLRFLDGFAPLKGDTFDFLIASSVQEDSQVQVQVQNLLAGFEYDLSYIDGAYRLTALNNATFVPEPNSAILLLPGLYALFIRRKRAG